jgi:hypothetical protein
LSQIADVAKKVPKETKNLEGSTMSFRSAPQVQIKLTEYFNWLGTATAKSMAIQQYHTRIRGLFKMN